VRQGSSEEELLDLSEDEFGLPHSDYLSKKRSLSATIQTYFQTMLMVVLGLWFAGKRLRCDGYLEKMGKNGSKIWDWTREEWITNMDVVRSDIGSWGNERYSELVQAGVESGRRKLDYYGFYMIGFTIKSKSQTTRPSSSLSDQVLHYHADNHINAWPSFTISIRN
jgi:hypothetical protein